MTEPRSRPEQIAEAEGTFDALVYEVATKLESGEPVDLDAIAVDHPEHADRLRKLLPTLQAMAELGHSGTASLAAPPESGRPAEPKSGVLGDYRILREIGRGGMGVVYEAEQVSLGRTVALKVLPFAAVLDPKHLKRFQNEARAAASLRHPNIVQVHSVGCEGAVHFYAMDYVEGQTLAEVIRDLRRIEGLDEGEVGGQKAEVGGRKAEVGKRDGQAESGLAESLASGQFAPPKGGSDPNAPSAAYAQETTPDGADKTGRSAQTPISTERSTKSPAYFRSIAEIGVQVARALDHAHEQGVIHRDVKPSNVILDVEGKAWVTDFGLARIETDATLTISGDLLGTVRYMSPEQALAKRIVVDHRTDVYSLGVTLYELLTLQPAFTGQDREELLRQIAFEEPRQPRRLNKSVPSELETIVLKAMAKNPADRYDTAQDLADDLERFLEDKPIRAKRPTLVQRTAKWSRRHKPVVWSAAILLVMGVLGLSGSTLVLSHKQSQLVDQRNVAQDALEDAQAQRRRVQENLKLAFQALDAIYLKEAEERLLRDSRLEQLDRQLLQQGLEFYEQFAQANSQDPSARLETGKAHRRVGWLRFRLGDHANAEKAYRQAIPILERLAHDSPNVFEYWQELAHSRIYLGSCLANTGRRDDAERVYREALAGAERNRQQFGHLAEYRALTGRFHHGFGCLLFYNRQVSEAEQALRRALAIQQDLTAEFPNLAEYRLDLALSQFRLSCLLEGTGRLTEAEQPSARAVALLEELAAECPDDPDYATSLPECYHRHGWILASTGRLEKAEEVYRRGMAASEKAAEDFPNLWAHREQRARCHLDLAALLRRTGRLEEAEQAFGQAVALYDELVTESPGFPKYFANGALAHWELARLLGLRGQLDEAEQAYRRAITLYEEVMADFPEAHDCHEGYPFCLNWFGNFLSTAGRAEEAEEAYQRAIRLFRDRVAEFPGVPKYRTGLDEALMGLGNLLQNTGRPQEAEQTYREALAVAEKVAETAPEALDPDDPACLYFNLAILLQKTDRVEEAEKTYRQALAFYEKAVAGFPSVPLYRKILAKTLHNLGFFREKRNRPEEAEELYRRALAIKEGLVTECPEVPEYWRLFLSTSHRLSALLTESGRLDEAEKLYSKAVDLRPDEADPLVARGDWYARRGQWEKAAADFAKAVELAPEDHWNWYRLAPVRLQIGDVEGYRRHCRQMLQRFGQTDDPKIARRTAQACQLAPDALEDPHLPAALAEFAIKEAATSSWSPVVRGEAHYRVEEFEQAAERLRQAASIEKGGDYRNVMTHLFLSMAHRRLGQTEEARQSLAQARQVMEAELPKTEGGDLGGGWHDWLMCQIIRREAEELIDDNDE